MYVEFICCQVNILLDVSLLVMKSPLLLCTPFIFQLENLTVSIVGHRVLEILEYLRFEFS